MMMMIYFYLLGDKTLSLSLRLSLAVYLLAAYLCCSFSITASLIFVRNAESIPRFAAESSLGAEIRYSELSDTRQCKRAANF